MNIITQNPFRVLGLTGNATEKELQKQIGIIKRYAEVGKSKSFDYDFEFIGNFTRNSDDVQEASNRIEQAHKKLLYSLFWFVKNNPFDEIAFNNLKEKEIDKAIEIWDKTLKEEITSKNYSSYLNLSTLYIALSTIDDQIELQKLQAGISLKGNLINSESLKCFSKLVTGNGIANDPIEISKKFVDEVIELLKPYLNKMSGISTDELISLFNTFPSSIKKYIASKFTEVPISNIENAIEKAKRKRKVKPSNAHDYGEELYKSTKTDLSSLRKVMTSSNVQLKILADKIANEIIQCSVDFFNERQKNDSEDNFESNLNLAIKLVKRADSVASSDQIKERAKENINTLLTMKDREVNQAIALLQTVKDAYKTNEARIRKQVKELEQTDNDIILGRKTINHSAVESNIKNSIDWNKVVELILESIPSKNIEKIKNINDDSKLNQFKGLVEFILEKMSYSNKNRVQYLCYWKAVNTPIKTTNASTTSGNSNSSSDNTGCIVFIVIGVIIAIAVAISSSNNSSTSYSNTSTSSNTYSTQPSYSTNNNNTKPTNSTPIVSKYEGNKLENGSSPYNAFFGAGVYNKNHQNSITFKNGYNTDAIVCLVNYYTEKTIRNEYIQASTSFQMTNLPNGTYYMKVFSGKDWNPTKVLANGKIKGGFDTSESFYQSKNSSDLLQLNDNGYQYSTGEITLYKVSSGNMQTQSMSETSFFN